MAEDAPNPAEQIERQMAGQWSAMLGLMTQQGATRHDVMELAAATALVILNTTGSALWPEGEAVHPELEEAATWTAVEAHAEGLLQYIRERKEAASAS